MISGLSPDAKEALELDLSQIRVQKFILIDLNFD
jgi:hypothetical protein